MSRKACAAQHFGPWMIEHNWFRQAVDAVRSGKWKPSEPVGRIALENGTVSSFKMEDEDLPMATDFLDDDDEGGEPSYRVVNGVAIISIDGQMTKRGSSFGGCSTIETRRAIRHAARDRMVNKIMLYIDSPGGTVSGTSDLAADVRAAGEQKVLWAFIANMGASAAYWVASQADQLWCNEVAMVGSIGTYALLCDESKYDEEWGLKYTLVSTGPFKGLGADGKVTDALVSDVQREINDLNERFLSAVAAGRGFDDSTIRALADGRVHIGAKAAQEGLVDVVGTFDAALTALIKEKPMSVSTEQVNAFLVENPDIKNGFIAQGHKAGLAEGTANERNRCLSIVETGGTRTQLSIDAIKSGQDPDGFKSTVAAIDRETKSAAEQVTQVNTAKDAEIAELKQKLEAAQVAASGSAGVNTAAATKDRQQQEQKAAENGEKTYASAEEQAKDEWATNANDCKKSFVSEKAYVAFRKNELAGNIKYNPAQ